MIIELLPLVAPTAVSVLKGAVPVITSAAASSLTKTINSAMDWWKKYDGTCLKEIEKIQGIYQMYCKLEQTHALSTLESLNYLKGEKEDSKQANSQSYEFKLPIFFKMHEKFPLLYHYEFKPQKDMEKWLCYAGKGYLRQSIDQAIGYICQYQEERGKRYLGGGFDYDPTNLFFAELKCWFIALSKVPIDKDVLEIINGRINYLDEIINDSVFKPGGNKPTREQIVLYLRDILENDIKPKVILILNRNSSREQFDKLKIHVEHIIGYGIQSLFYIFRECEEIPANFILEQIRRPTIPPYETIIKNSTSGKLLSYLLNLEAIKLVISEHNPYSQNQSSYKNIIKNAFFEGDQLIYPLGTNLVHRLNWFKHPEMPSGILESFRSTELMNTFLKMHGLLQKLCLFSLICHMLFELSGDGGNLLVYGNALWQVKTALKTFKQLVKDMKNDFRKLYQAADLHHRRIVEKEIDLTSTNEKWRKCFNKARKSYLRFIEDIDNALSLVSNIENKIIEVNSKGYVDWIKQQLIFLAELVTGFSGENKNVTENIKVESSAVSNKPPTVSPQSPDSLLEFRKSQVKPLDDKDFQAQFNQAVQFYKNKEYQKALDDFLKLIKESPAHIDLNLYCGNTLVALGKKTVGIQYFNNVLYLNSQHKLALYYKCATLNALGELAEAQKLVNYLINNYPQEKSDNKKEQTVDIKDLILLKDEIVDKKRQVQEWYHKNQHGFHAAKKSVANQPTPALDKERVQLEKNIKELEPKVENQAVQQAKLSISDIHHNLDSSYTTTVTTTDNDPEVFPDKMLSNFSTLSPELEDFIVEKAGKEIITFINQKQYEKALNRIEEALEFIPDNQDLKQHKQTLICLINLKNKRIAFEPENEPAKTNLQSLSL